MARAVFFRNIFRIIEIRNTYARSRTTEEMRSGHMARAVFFEIFSEESK